MGALRSSFCELVAPSGVTVSAPHGVSVAYCEQYAWDQGSMVCCGLGSLLQQTAFGKQNQPLLGITQCFVAVVLPFAKLCLPSRDIEVSLLCLPHGWDSPRVAVAGRHLTCVCRWRQSNGSVRQCWSQRGCGNLLSMWLRGRSRPRSWCQKRRRLRKSTKLLVAPLARTCLEHQGICTPLY